MNSTPKDMAEKIEQARKHTNINGMTPAVFRININGQTKYGFNFQPVSSMIGDRFHYDYGYGIEKNKDAEIVWLKEPSHQESQHEHKSRTLKLAIEQIALELSNGDSSSLTKLLSKTPVNAINDALPIDKKVHVPFREPTDPTSYYFNDSQTPITQAGKEEWEAQSHAIANQARLCTISDKLFNALIDAGFTSLAESLDILTAEVAVEQIIFDQMNEHCNE